MQKATYSTKKDIYKFNNVDNSKPNLYKDMFSYSEVPRICFNNIQLPMDLPEEIWVTDTTFRDGQQSMPPFSSKQIVTLYDYLNQLDNNSGIIRQTEFFLYTDKDLRAVEKCMERGYRFPEITSWIRATSEDLKLVKNLSIKETGMLMSCSDYHIYKKLNLDKEEAMKRYLYLAEEALASGIVPRCHLEDITRSDFFGFVVPFVTRLMDLSKKYNMKVKVRLCDTLGLGVSHSGVELPRSVQGLVHGLRYYCHVPSENIEWHGHNDFNAVVTNSVTSWLYGCSGVNTTLLGIGERTGNCSLESMLFEYAQLKGTTKNMNLEMITEIAEFFKKDLKYDIDVRKPFVGGDFNVTKAGIHADGLLKDEEIYNIFDTEKILNRPVLVAINQYSGLAGVAAWINGYFRLKNHEKIDKRDKRIESVKLWVDDQYNNGRTSIITNDEMERLLRLCMPELFKESSAKAI